MGDDGRETGPGQRGGEGVDGAGGCLRDQGRRVCYCPEVQVVS